jgi:two-component sensor histidine kinase
MANVQCITRAADRPSRVDWLPESTQREERLLFTVHELSHRTKNLLAVIQAIASQTRQRSVSLDDFDERFSARLQGLSRSLDLLVSEDGSSAAIMHLMRSQLEPFGNVDGLRIAVKGPPVWLNSEATRNIGLALHELATNAIKHGALSVPEGFITVDWEVRADDTGSQRFYLIWREHYGPAVLSPQHRGFGHVVLQRMTHQALQGKVDHAFEADGVSWALEAPLVAVAMPESTESVCEVACGLY